MHLTHDNYFSREASLEYMSVSQYKRWCECPARARAELLGEWSEPTSPAMLGSSYADVAILSPDELPAWMDTHEVGLRDAGLVSKKDGVTPLSTMRAIGLAIHRAQSEPVIQEYLEGEHQRIFTCEIGGVPWKCCLDVYNEGVSFTDLKVMASLDETYTKDWDIFTTLVMRREGVRPQVAQGRWAWYEAYNYWLQMAVYQAAIARNDGDLLEPYLLALTKDADLDKGRIPAVQIVRFTNQGRLAHEIEKIEGSDAVDGKLPVILRWKSGEEEAPMCGQLSCAYCRAKMPIEPIDAIDFRHGMVG
ncbi:MAG: PD-(D/E)XK nuclease-like domain-containing protein [Acidobacteriota bacterium]